MIYKIKRFLIVLLFFTISFVSYGEDPPPPPPCPTGGGTVGGPLDGPIENGVPIVIGLALFYGAFKLQQARRKLKEKEKEV